MTVHLCDRCKKPDEAPLTRLGIIRPLDYCRECAPIVVEYLAAVDMMHEQTVEYWNTELEKLRAEYGMQGAVPC